MGSRYEQKCGQSWGGGVGTNRQTTQGTSYHFSDHLLPQEPPHRGLELWGRRDKAPWGIIKASWEG